MPEAPDPALLLALHERLMNGDRRSSEELSRLVLSALLDSVARKFQGVDDHLIGDGVIDAVLDYCARPSQFDPSRGVPLFGCLSRAAWCNVENLRCGEKRRKAREQGTATGKREKVVALDPAARKIQQEEQGIVEKRCAAMFDALSNPKDKEILRLRLEGVRATAPYAQVLGITDLPPKQQRDEVKRHKERIRQFLRRKGLRP
jgi:hypothetical protein